MTTWSATITAVFDCDFEDVVDEFTAWVTMPSCVEQGLIITPHTAVTDDVFQLNDIWNRLSVAAKRSWVEAMMPEPETYGENPCVGCGGTDMPLHTDGRCPNCHTLDTRVDEHGPEWGYPPADYIPACPECGEPDLPLHGSHE
jgi:hypothetical protein